MTDWILNNLWATGGIVVALLFVAHRFIKNEKCTKFGITVGEILTEKAVRFLGAKNCFKLANEGFSWAGAFAHGIKMGYQNIVKKYTEVLDAQDKVAEVKNMIEAKK